MKTISTLIAVSAILLCSSCLTLKPLEYKSMDNLTVSKDIQKPEVKFDLKLNNPNNWGVTLRKVKLNITLNGASVGGVDNSKKVRIKSKEDFTIPLIAAISMKEISKTGVSGLFGGGGITMNIKGEVVIRKWFLTKKISIDLSELMDKSKFNFFK